MRLEMPWPDLAAYPSYGLVRTRLDFDESEDGGLTIVNDVAPLRVVGAGTFTCVLTGPF